MATSMADIKTLRNKTGAGFADCKKALEKADNNMNSAIKILKEMGVAAAEKRSGRATGEGSLFVEARGNKAVLLELLCETDFVARNDDFQTLGKDLINDVFEQELTDKSDSLQAKVQETIATIKENMELKRIKVINKSDDEIFATYTHGVPARLGSIVVLKSNSKDKAVEKLAFNCALHAVAKIPLFLNPDSISEEYKKEQMDLINTQVTQLGKPEQVAKNIAQGKWNKHTTEICFLQQSWVHDEKSTTEKEIKVVANQIDADISLSNYVVFNLGTE